MRRFLAIVFYGLALSIPASAAVSQPAPQPAPERVAFNSLADRLVGRWSCDIRELDPSGKVKWTDNQVRVFSRAFLGNALEERAYKPPRLDQPDNFGLHVLLLQRPGFAVTQYGIWPGAAARIFIVEGTLRPDGTGFDGTMVATDAQGKQDKRRVAMDVIAPDRHLYRVYSRTADGSEFLMEELTYTRA